MRAWERKIEKEKKNDKTKLQRVIRTKRKERERMCVCVCKRRDRERRKNEKKTNPSDMQP